MEANFPRRREVMELLKQFPKETVEEYGQCIVIPGEKWEPDWEGEIPNDCIETMHNNKPVILVQIRLEDLTVRPEEEKQTKEENIMRRWPKEEAARLFARANEFAKTMLLKDVAHAIYAEGRFPERTELAIKLKYAKMRKSVELTRKYTPKLKKTVDTQTPPVQDKVLDSRVLYSDPRVEEMFNRLEVMEETIARIENNLNAIIGLIDHFSTCPNMLLPKDWHNYWLSLK